MDSSGPWLMMGIVVVAGARIFLVRRSLMVCIAALRSSPRCAEKV